MILELAGAESPRWVKWFAALAAILGAFDLVIGYGHRANQHRDLKRRFCVLERKLIQADPQQNVQQLKVERSEIEADEPPVFRALDAQCHNEMCAAMGYSRTKPDESCHYRKIPWFKRATANWIHWPNLGASSS